ncbi:MAG: SAM-dependent methyltransferase [Actinomycetia bacterium]|nr:SAM-dependent methyltransferase [Actinomycetes bacterium]
MRENVASHTAQQVAAYRLSFDRPTAPFGDPAADESLARDIADGVAVDHDRPMARYLRARTAFFDRCVLRAFERGARQVVTIGAGYDARALRYARPGVRWFEADHPATQRDKRARLDRLGIDATPITFVPADLTRHHLATALIEAGFAPATPALMLCEGVVVYLAPAVAADLFAQLRAIAAPGTRLALSRRIPGSGERRREDFAARVAALGEPLAIGDADVPALLAAAGWRAIELSSRASRVGLLLVEPD